jgi:hypothetical protein
MEDLLYVVEYLRPGDYVMIKNGVISKYYPDTQCIECDNYEDGYMKGGINCAMFERVCPLDLPYRKYCIEYEPLKEQS